MEYLNFKRLLVLICFSFFFINCEEIPEEETIEDTEEVVGNDNPDLPNDDNEDSSPPPKDDTDTENEVEDNSPEDEAEDSCNIIDEGGDSNLGSDERPRRDNNITFGNPSDACSNDPDNYLISRPEYVLAYSNSKGHPNWVSWHLSSSWQGSEGRCNCFQQDFSLPDSFNVITENSYRGSGFQRGHLTSSSDRDFNASENESTYLMTNIAPQTIDNNTGPWVQLEIYLRRQLRSGNEIFIIAGGQGTGGTGTRGFRERIGGGLVNVPASFWKVAIILPNGANDISRVTTSSRVIAVNIPNNQGVSDNWRNFQTSIDRIEELTGYDFFENIPDAIENSIEAKVSDE